MIRNCLSELSTIHKFILMELHILCTYMYLQWIESKPAAIILKHKYLPNKPEPKNIAHAAPSNCSPECVCLMFDYFTEWLKANAGLECVGRIIQSARRLFERRADAAAVPVSACAAPGRRYVFLGSASRCFGAAHSFADRLPFNTCFAVSRPVFAHWFIFVEAFLANLYIRVLQIERSAIEVIYFKWYEIGNKRCSDERSERKCFRVTTSFWRRWKRHCECVCAFSMNPNIFHAPSPVIKV